MTRYRLKVIQIVIPVITFLVITRLFYWQIIRGDELTSKAALQHNSIVTLPAHRGDILDVDGSLLSGSQTNYLLYVYKPQLKEDPSKVVNLLTPIIASSIEITTSSAEIVPDLKEKTAATKALLEEKLNINRSWVALKHYLTYEQKQAIEELNIKGLGFDEEVVRFYPEASMSAHLLGFVGQDVSGNPQGYFGLEGYYDRLLQGRGGKVRQETDASGNPILIGNFSRYSSFDGHTLNTSINRSAQYQIEKLLKIALVKYGAVSGSVVVMNPQTGAIIAMANMPTYDPRIFYKYDSNLHKNTAVADIFEPGSIFKPIIMASAIDAGVVEPETKCDSCSQPIVIGQYTIKNWNDKYQPEISMTDTIVHSDNTGMIFAAKKLGEEKLLSYLDKFGFNKPTGIDLQEEISGKLKNLKEFREIDLATTSFGQGIAVTRIQVIAATNAIANQGIWVQPYLVESISDAKKTVPTRQHQSQKVISPETAEKVKQMMIAAVDNGEAKWAKPKDIKIAGKTGTAQIPVSGHYDEEKTIASFVGFAPANNPKFTMLVTLREPTSSPWGSETAAPLWFEIAKQLLLLDL